MASDGNKAGGRVLPIEPARSATGRCPICGRPSRKESRPFCSRHCADIDLARWLDGRYRIPTSDSPDQAEGDLSGEDET